MQATVSTFDAETGSGSLLLDDGSTLAFGAAAFQASGLRLLRPGQRMRLHLSDAGEVADLTIISLQHPCGDRQPPASSG